MTPLGDGQAIAVIENRATVLACHRDLCKGSQHIELTEYLSHVLETLGVLGKLLIQSFIELTLQRPRFLCGP
jgi:hypothetical protein